MAGVTRSKIYDVSPLGLSQYMCNNRSKRSFRITILEMDVGLRPIIIRWAHLKMK